MSRVPLLLLVLLALALGTDARAQSVPTPYWVIPGAWTKLPGGMNFGELSGSFPDPDGRHMWFLGRCAQNNCADSDRDPILKFDMEGNLVDSFGAGLFGFPHGFFLDDQGFLWVSEGAPHGDARADPGYRRGLGHQVHKLNQQGEVVMSLGVAGVHGCDETHLNGPAGVVLDQQGNIWVADGHRGGNNRIVKFSPEGRFLLQVGGCVGDESRALGQFDDPHDIKVDSQNRIFVADRGNNRIQIFDTAGNFLFAWTQFGKPSGLFIDRNDVLVSVDGLSGVERPDDRSNFGWERGIRIGDARTGWVEAFIPDTQPPLGAGIEFVGFDFEGNLYVNDYPRQHIMKWYRFRP